MDTLKAATLWLAAGVEGAGALVIGLAANTGSMKGSAGT